MNSHTLLAKTIHWTFSILYAYGIFKQVEDLDELEDATLLNFEIIFAVIFLVIVMLRFFYMKDAKTLLGAHEEMHKGHLFIAKVTHRLVYFSLIMLPTTGLLIAGIFNLDIPGMGIAIALHEFSAFFKLHHYWHTCSCFSIFTFLKEKAFGTLWFLYGKRVTKMNLKLSLH